VELGAIKLQDGHWGLLSPIITDKYRTEQEVLLMKRTIEEPRDGWREKIASQGVVYNDTKLEDGTVLSYWNESAAYEFSREEVDDLSDTVEELHDMSLEAARFLADEQLKDESPWHYLGLTDEAAEYAVESLNRADPDVYGRFDLVYHGDGTPAKMLEYNADTPTGLLEAGLAQWYWKKDVYGDKHDQWNFLHEALIERWAEVLAEDPGNGTMHFVHADVDKSGEDLMNTAYLRDTAQQAGWLTEALVAHEIGVDENNVFYDHFDRPLNAVFKLYPWEDLAWEDFGEQLMVAQPSRWFEPAWKMFLSTKALPAAMWHLFPNHENLLPTYMELPKNMKEYVKKPLHGREGDTIEVVSKDLNITYPGRYGEEGFVYQKWSPLPNFPGANGEPNHPVLGTWVVGGTSVGVGIRESDGFITDYYCRFVPNIIR
jgi:glutathionylspermidine synthase